MRCDGGRCCFFCDDDDLVFVGRGASKEIVLTAFCKFESFAEFSNGGGKIAHGQIGFFQSGDAAQGFLLVQTYAFEVRFFSSS